MFFKRNKQGDNKAVETEERGLKDHRVAISSIDELTNPKQEEEYKQAVKAAQNQIKKENLYVNYKLPSIDLLEKTSSKKNTKEQEEEIRKNITLLQNVLKDFNVYAKVVEVHVGPSVTQYELEVKRGTELSKITKLHKEIALSLAAKDVIIEAPIPGKSTVGIIIPNKSVSLVTFREVLAYFPKEKLNNKSMVALGKDILGNPKYFELSKASPLLISGTTGSGKSVCMNTMICSILMRAKPDEVKLTLIDTKRLEFPIYNGIPHLITPVVTDPKKGIIALERTQRELERRYNLFIDSKTKNIEEYNGYIKKKNVSLSEEEKIPLLPYWVVIIDDIMDLVRLNSEGVDSILSMITKFSKQTGVLIVLSAQRPSSELFSSETKENILSRISFVTASVIDSKNILNMPGAELLKGKGDMLFLPAGENTPLRVQGAYVSENEIYKLVDFCSSQQKAIYGDEPSISELYTSDKNDVSEDDPIYEEALEFILSTGKASASLLQRKFKLGYNRAARLIDLFEERGIIGPQQGSAPREVLYKVEDKDE